MGIPRVIEAFIKHPDFKKRVEMIEDGIYIIKIGGDWDSLLCSIFLAVNDSDLTPNKIRITEKFDCGGHDKNIFFSGKYLPMTVWGTPTQLVDGTLYKENKDDKSVPPTTWFLFPGKYLLVGPLLPI